MTGLKPQTCRSVARRTGPGSLLTALAVLLQGAAHAADVAWEGGITTILQDANDRSIDPELTASADLFITVPRSAGEWLIYLEASTAPRPNGVSAYYPTANADAGSVLTPDGNSGVQISELHYTFHAEKKRSLMLGLINPSAWLDRSRITNDENTHFVNGNFKNNMTIDFPDYTLGAMMRSYGSATWPEIVIIFADSHGIADLPDRSYQDLLDLTSDQRGVFVGAGASWLRERTTLRLGAWLRSDDHVVTGAPDETEMNYGVYSVVGLQSDVSAFNFRAGIANEDVSIATRFVAVAYERSTGIGLFGLGFARTRISSGVPQADLDDASAVETFLRIPISSSRAQITPSVQYLESPDFDTAGATSSSYAVVAGVRFHWSF